MMLCYCCSTHYENSICGILGQKSLCWMSKSSPSINNQGVFMCCWLTHCWSVLSQKTINANCSKTCLEWPPLVSRKVVFQDRWSFQTGSVCMDSSERTFHWWENGISSQGVLFSGLIPDRFHCTQFMGHIFCLAPPLPKLAYIWLFILHLTGTASIFSVGLLQNTVKPVWNYPLWKDHPVWKDHFPVSENLYLPLDSMQTEPVWKDHFFLKSMVVVLSRFHCK